MKEIRDRKAREDYVRDEGIQIGTEQGIILTKTIFQLSSQGLSEQEIAKQTNSSLALVQEILNI